MSNNIVPLRKKKNRPAAHLAQKQSGEFSELAQHFPDRDIPVFPVKHDSKIPLTPKGFKDTLTNPKQIVRRQHLWDRFSSGLTECFCSS